MTTSNTASNQATNIDLNIVERDLSLDALYNPAKLSEADVIVQDVKHRILESGLLPRLVKLRNKNSIAMTLTEIELIVEQDERLIPGSIEIYYNTDKTVSVLADTKEYGKITSSHKAVN
jgi:hypothetical protein